MRCRELVSVAELSATERTAFTSAVLALKAAPSKITAAANAVTAGGGTPNRYDDFVWMHSTVQSGAHFGSAFGPWHREFLRQIEFDLRQVSGNNSIVIPFWDWTTGSSAASPNWPFTNDLLGPLGDAAGLVTAGPFSNPATFRMNIRRTVFRDDNAASLPDNNTQLRRRPAATPAGFNLPSAATARTGIASNAPYDASPFNEFDEFITAINSGATQAQINALINGWTAASFRKYLEWFLHNGPHTWVGGSDDWPSGPAPTFVAGPMSIPAVSPNDPVFWLHHCNVDRLWSAWQQRHPPAPGQVAGYVPASGADAGHNAGDNMVHFAPANAANFNAPLRSTPLDVVDSRGQLDIWYTSDLPTISLVTPSVDFGDVPANLTTDWPAKFEVRTCRRVKFRISAVGGANYSVPAGQGDVLADHSDTLDPVGVNVFLEFVALGAPNVVQPGTATIAAFIDDTEGYYTGTVGAEYQVGTFNITMAARPVPAPRAAVTFVLDRSGSMSESAGPAGTKYDLLRSSLRVVAAVMRNDDAVGLVTYDDVTATLTPAMPQMGTVMPVGAGRQAVEDAITTGALTPRNGTAIGKGMIAGATVLGTVQADATYAIKAMVVMTDGNENVAPSVTDGTVTAAIAWFNNQVYAIGLGDETNVSAGTLGAIARYQLITGHITTSEQRFLLTKYFVQILAAVTDSAIVVDPQGELRLGEEHRIGFDICGSDVTMDVLVICPIGPLLDATLIAPDGTVIHPASGPNVRHQIDTGDQLYRIGLPAIPASPLGTHAGRWTAVLRIGRARQTSVAVLSHVDSTGAAIDRQALAEISQRGALPYQLFVQSYSNLKMDVDVTQDSYLPGAMLGLFARLQEYRQPLAGARVFVEITEPDGLLVIVPLTETGTGRFEGSHATNRKGIYRCRFRAAGTSRGGHAFQREDTRTAAVNQRIVVGGTLTPDGTGGHDGDDDRRRWCELWRCLLEEPAIARLLRKLDIDPRDIEKCLGVYCREEHRRMADREHHTSAEARPSDEAERLERILVALRTELRAAGLQSVRLEELFTSLPKSRSVAGPPVVTAMNAEHGGMAHHVHALPAVVTDDEGKFRVMVPAVLRAHAKTLGKTGKEGGGGKGGHSGHPHGGSEGGSGHTHGGDEGGGGHTHGGHDHG